MFSGMRTFAQKVANRFMDEPVTIRHKKEFELDPSNPYGDDTVEFETDTTETVGWMVSSLTKNIDAQGGLATVAERDLIRLPVGTRVDTGDEITIRGETWTVVDTSSDETWPAMLKVAIAKAG